VVGARVIQPLAVGDECVEQPTQFKQSMPIAAVSGQARRVQAHDQSGLAQADLGDQALKAVPFVARAPRFTEVIIDNHHPITRPTEPDSTFDESILQVSAFAVVDDLVNLAEAWT